MGGSIFNAAYDWDITAYSKIYCIINKIDSINPMQEQGTPDLEEQGQRQTTCINTKIWNLRLHPRLHQNFQSVFNMYDLNWKYTNLYSEKRL